MDRRFMMWPDCANRDPFRGLPPDFPAGHSRFPVVPSAGYSGLSFDPSFGENARPEEQMNGMTTAERRAWHDAMLQSIGDLIEVPPIDGQDD